MKQTVGITLIIGLLFCCLTLASVQPRPGHYDNYPWVYWVAYGKSQGDPQPFAVWYVCYGEYVGSETAKEIGWRSMTHTKYGSWPQLCGTYVFKAEWDDGFKMLAKGNIETHSIIGFSRKKGTVDILESRKDGPTLLHLLVERI